MDSSIKKIKEKVMRKNFFSRYIVFIFGVFLLATNYNLFLVPNNFVTGGTSGLAIIFKTLFSWNTSIFLGIVSILLLALSFILLGTKSTRNSVIGSLLYPLMVSITAPLANMLLKHLTFDTTIIPVVIAGLLQGTANGLIFKMGFNTGGSDILMKIVNKYVNIPEGKAILGINILIILGGAYIFGPTKFIYSMIILILNTTMVDRILAGVSNSKLFIIYSKNAKEIQEYIINDLKSGVTIFKAKGGYSKEKNEVLMCVVPNRDYYLFKKMVLEIDPFAFFVINDCYEVEGGVKRTNLPFI